MTTSASARARNHSMLRHSSRNLPLKLSLTSICHGLPGSLNAVPMPCTTIEFSTARATNSGPLSQRSQAGAVRSLTSRGSTSTMRPERIRLSATIASPSRWAHWPPPGT